jgi:ArsR family metal-binding transcriptional regulator
MKTLAKGLQSSNVGEEDIKAQIEMYKDGFIRLTEPIGPKAIMRLDDDISKSIRKMEMIKEMLKYLPGIDCGVCGAPTCRAFAEDIVKGEDQNAICLVKTMESFKSNGKV